jgi:hypothetical protein
MAPPRDLELRQSYATSTEGEANARNIGHSEDVPPIACIVGAPRCGTTTFARWLKRREEICFSKIKEPHFFTLVDLADVPADELVETIEKRYLERFFPHRHAGTGLLAEGSISYLYAPEKLLPMLRMWPSAKFIIALRDPFELLPSVHQRLLYQGDEVVADFAEAWRLQEARSQGRNIPRSCIDARQLQYLEVARLGKHVSRFFEVIGREKCHIALFDELRDDPAAAYRNLLRFLGLNDDGFRDFRVNRPSRSFRYGWLQRALKRPTVVTKAALAGSSFQYRFGATAPKNGSYPERALTLIRRKLLKWNQREACKPTLSPQLQDEIRNLLRDDVSSLARLIGRDLDHWLGAQGRGVAVERPASHS